MVARASSQVMRSHTSLPRLARSRFIGYSRRSWWLTTSLSARAANAQASLIERILGVAFHFDDLVAIGIHEHAAAQVAPRRRPGAAAGDHEAVFLVPKGVFVFDTNKIHLFNSGLSIFDLRHLVPLSPSHFRRGRCPDFRRRHRPVSLPGLFPPSANWPKDVSTIASAHRKIVRWPA